MDDRKFDGQANLSEVSNVMHLGLVDKDHVSS